MARKTKDLESLEEKEKEKNIKTTEKKATTKKVATKKTTTKKATEKKTATKTATAKKTATKTTAKKATTKTTTKTATKAATKAPTKKASTKTATKATAKKTSTKVAKKSSTTKFAPEYYDLPYIYNKTTVKLLAQSPTTLFVYWELSEQDRNNLRKKYGENFFEVTKPILLVFNDTLNYSFEVDINDFANSWYIHVNDSNCDYRIELGRKALPIANQISTKPVQTSSSEDIKYTYIPYYTYLTSSNETSSPNDKMLFNLDFEKIKFKNIKTGEETEKDFKFITNFGIFKLKDLFNNLFPNENFEFENFLSGSHSSGNPSSGSLSSRFK